LATCTVAQRFFKDFCFSCDHYPRAAAGSKTLQIKRKRKKAAYAPFFKHVCKKWRNLLAAGGLLLFSSAVRAAIAAFTVGFAKLLAP
jgi:hypothetical protein